MVELALVAVRAFLLVGAGLSVRGQAVLGPAQEDVKGWAVSAEWVVGRHEPKKINKCLMNLHIFNIQFLNFCESKGSVASRQLCLVLVGC